MDLTTETEVPTPKTKGYTILLIEDNPDHRMLERRALQTLGKSTQVTTVATAVEALGALERQEFDS